MKEWKLRREVYYRLFEGTFDDDLNDKGVEFDEDVVQVVQGDRLSGRPFTSRPIRYRLV